MTREDLRELLESGQEQDDIITQILNRHHARLEQVKKKDSEAKDRAETLEKELEEARKTIEEIKNENGDNASLQETIKKHQETIKNLRSELNQNKIVSAVELKLAKSGVKNSKLSDMIFKSLDLEAVKIDKDGNVEGIDEQIEALKEDEDTASLFKSEPQNASRQSYDPVQGSSNTVSAFEQMLQKEAAEIQAQREKPLFSFQSEG